jgi:hypothetical protein
MHFHGTSAWRPHEHYEEQYSGQVSFIEPSFAGIYAQTIGRSLKLKVYGELIQPLDKSLNIWELKIVPLAIY